LKEERKLLITIVSGLPRSGTSLMMQMLAAGGLPSLTDGDRKPDIDNPRGYCEWEPIKQLPKDPMLIDQSEGKAVKIITQLLLSVPKGRDYKLIFMERPIPEVLASQDEMLKRRGTKDLADHAIMTNAFKEHLKAVAAFLERRDDLPLLRVGYRKLIDDPAGRAKAIRDFLGQELDVNAMTLQVDPALYRNKRP
jgi:hypothetical protein